MRGLATNIFYSSGDPQPEFRGPLSKGAPSVCVVISERPVSALAGDDLKILMPRAAVSVLVLNPRIRESDVPIVVRQFVLARPACNLFGFTVRPAAAVLLAAIPLMEEPLVVPLELVVQDDAFHSAAVFADALLGAQIGTIDLRVVSQLARFSEARVEGLSWLPRTFVSLMPIRFEQLSAVITENDGAII